MGPFRGVIVVCAAAVILQTASAAGPGQEEFAARRARVLASLDSASALVLRAPEERIRSGDTGYKYRTDSNLLYLTGEDRPGLTLVLVPRGVHVEGVPARVIMCANVDNHDGSPALQAPPDGVLCGPDELRQVLDELLPSIRVLYGTTITPGFVNDWLNNRPLFLERDVKTELEKRYPSLKVKGPNALLGRLRAIKSPAEIEQIRRAIAATGEGIAGALRVCRPGAKEYELQAVIEYAMLRHGASAPAFSSIIGSGPNSLVLHYEYNQRTMHAGDVVVMDVGAEIEGYAADVTRTIPVSGKFTPEQRKVYDVVLRAQEAIIKVIRAGTPWPEMDRAARGVIDAAGFGKYWRHSVSHHMGIDVHDVGPMDTLRAGMVITMEPGVYIPVNDTTVAPGLRGVGIRIEDDALVTEGGCTVLSAGIPKAAEEVERAMERSKK